MPKATQISVRLTKDEMALLEKIRSSYDVPNEISNAFIVRTAIAVLYDQITKKK